MVKIYLDAGHGGYDNGATGNGLVEKALNLALIEKIKALLQANYQNIEIMTTRDTDIFLSLNERCNRANNWGADVFLSCHANANTNASARGWSSHIYTTPSKESIALQNVLHPEVFNQIKGDGVPDLGKKNSNFAVVRQTKMPAILTESLFVSNTADANLLKQDSFNDKLAMGHVVGLEKFLGLEKANIPPPENATQSLYQVIAGTFGSRENAQTMVDNLKKVGIESYINQK